MVVYCRSKFYIAGIRIFYLFCSCDLDLDMMIFIYELDPYPVEIYRMCENELPIARLSKVIILQTNRQTDRPPKYIPRRFAGGQ